jgi:hypothetical protein
MFHNIVQAERSAFRTGKLLKEVERASVGIARP